MKKEVKAYLSRVIRFNTPLRTIAKPIMDIKGKIELYKYIRSEDSNYIKSFKNKHEGKRCFIVGNGPSLSGEDLDLIKNEISFGFNRIYNIFPKTLWKPTYYMCVDRQVIIEEIDNIKNLKGTIKFIRTYGKKYGQSKYNDIHYVLLYGSFIPDIKKKVVKTLSKDVSQYFSFNTQTVAVSAIEFAIYMGFTEIYLIGMDHNQPMVIDSSGKVTIKEGAKSHFDGGESKAKNMSFNFIDATNECYRVCREYASERGIEIINCTRGGNLEVFKRKKLEEVLGIEEEG